MIFILQIECGPIPSFLVEAEMVASELQLVFELQQFDLVSIAVVAPGPEYLLLDFVPE